VTGQGAKVKINENCKLASLWDPQNPDESVDHYKAKLSDLYEKFRLFIEEGQAKQPGDRSQGTEEEQQGSEKLLDFDS